MQQKARFWPLTSARRVSAWRRARRAGYESSAGDGNRHSNDEKFEAIAKLVKEWQPKYFVVGLPTHTDGTEHELTRLSRKFGRRLHGRFNLPVYWVDERMSSLYAESLLAEAQVFGRKQKSVLDQVAAQAILQGFLKVGRPSISMVAKNSIIHYKGV